MFQNSFLISGTLFCFNIEIDILIYSQSLLGRQEVNVSLSYFAFQSVHIVLEILAIREPESLRPEAMIY